MVVIYTPNIFFSWSCMTNSRYHAKLFGCSTNFTISAESFKAFLVFIFVPTKAVCIRQAACLNLEAKCFVLNRKVSVLLSFALSNCTSRVLAGRDATYSIAQPKGLIYSTKDLGYNRTRKIKYQVKMVYQKNRHIKRMKHCTKKQPKKPGAKEARRQENGHKNPIETIRTRKGTKVVQKGQDQKRRLAYNGVVELHA